MPPSSVSSPWKCSTASVRLQRPPRLDRGAAAATLDLRKAVRHVLASLKKTISPPSTRTKLMATIRSLIRPAAGDQDVHSVLANVLAAGKVVIDDKGGVTYRF